MRISRGLTDLNAPEMKSILATIFRIPAERIEDWLIIVKEPCKDCDRPYCDNGSMGRISSRGGSDAQGNGMNSDAFDLHIMAKLINYIASDLDDEQVG